MLQLENSHAFIRIYPYLCRPPDTEITYGRLILVNIRSEGANVIGDSAAYPAYVPVTPVANSA
jgi:hypothetical protein